MWRASDRRNALIPLLLVAFAAADAGFLLAASGVLPASPQRLLLCGLLVVAGFITVIGLRVIPFFTHRAMERPQVAHPRWAGRIAMLAPLALAALTALGSGSPAALVAGLAGMVFNLVLLGLNVQKGVLQHPLLWILFAGYALTAIGLGLAGAALAFAPALLAAAVHLIAVGGICVLTPGMMTRTALGHTGRPLRLPGSMLPAYALMLLAALLRVAAAWPGGTLAAPLLHAAGGAFALSLLLFVVGYGRWLLSSRADGLPG